MMVGHTKSSSALWKWKRSSRQTIKREELAAAIATTLPTEPAPPKKNQGHFEAGAKLRRLASSNKSQAMTNS